MFKLKKSFGHVSTVGVVLVAAVLPTPSFAYVELGGSIGSLRARNNFGGGREKDSFLRLRGGIELNLASPQIELGLVLNIFSGYGEFGPYLRNYHQSLTRQAGHHVLFLSYTDLGASFVGLLRDGSTTAIFGYGFSVRHAPVSWMYKWDEVSDSTLLTSLLLGVRYYRIPKIEGQGWIFEVAIDFSFLSSKEKLSL